MKSTKDKNSPFTIEDFERGLMLAGYIAPLTLSELHEREELAQHETEIDKENSATFFKRIVLAAEIAFRLHEEPTFGHVKFQKLVYLCENAANMELNARYVKQAAGPYDRKFMHSIDGQLKKNKWFNVELIPTLKGKRYKYSPLEKCEDYKKYYNSYFGSHDSNIQFIIEIFKKEKTDFVEIAATIYACLIELSSQKLIIDQNNLFGKFYNWSKEKARFDQNQIISVWDWMKEKGIIPELSS